ncbi:hypothetical protein [Pleionea sp. CnH1-48]|uniref:hypothetical protein n=1 Tax=Pleionea sp. CnH1-48 TaxID=2954494 RepID=UPI002097FD08|nr:hypothetical protein [Pleionea sp. CnH1-48]MCO7226049.1 hypothetical protein [Pleionea sp. CnH1-48]
MKIKMLLIAAMALVLTSCYVKETVVTFADAENMHFTPEGRLFLSSGKGLFELRKESNEFIPRKISTQNCAFGGITQIGSVIYTVCSEVKLINGAKWLLAYDLANEADGLNIIHTIDGVSLTNGLTSDGESTLYMADTNYFGQGTIVKFSLNGNNKKQVLAQVNNWAGAEQGISHPNGMQFIDNSILLTDGGAVKRLFLDGMGVISHSETLARKTAIFDDLIPYCGGAVVTDYISGQLFYINSEGDTKFSSGPATFQGASSVLVGQPPMFNSRQLVVTEKGILFEDNSQIGNRVSTATFDFDLATCR